MTLISPDDPRVKGWDPVAFGDVAEGDTLRFLTRETGYGGRGIHERTGRVTAVTAKTVRVQCDSYDGRAVLRRADWGSRSVRRYSEPADTPKTYTYTAQTYGDAGGYVEKTFTVEGPLYHGGGRRLRQGAQLAPGRRTNAWGDERGTSTRVYFTTRLDVAADYARQSGGHVYEVEPTGVFTFDRSDEYKTEHPLTVLRRLDPGEWQ